MTGSPSGVLELYVSAAWKSRGQFGYYRGMPLNSETAGGRLLGHLKNVGQEALMRRGHFMADPGRNLYDQLRDQSDWRGQQEAMRLASGGPLAKVMPHAAAIAPDLVDQLHGSRGSPAVLAGRLAAGPYGLTPAQSAQSAQAVRGLDARARQGFSAGQLGNLYQAAAQRGLISPRTAHSGLGGVAALARVQGDLGLDRGASEAVEGLARQLGPQEAALRARTAANLAGGPGAFPGRLGPLDQRLRMGALGSQAGNEIAARVRAERLGIRDPRGLAMLRGQTVANQALLVREPELLHQVRKLQGPLDLQPLIGRRLAGRDPRLHLGEVEQIARQRFGVSGDELRALHDPAALDRAASLRRTAESEALLQSRLAHLGRATPVQRAADLVQQGGQLPAREALGRLLGWIPQRDIDQAMEQAR
jgi:hypothetical protein